ncbi:cytochrome P450 [Polaromonas sp.]|uniref:cytochrome P450 n=1 Tax=Polaromonas sp. TaxID=1869339 RepID=UPI0018182843|nr:cytochrome P450 [Polaromonas sp.]NML84838.1 cytochrome P450 [Polaromonas sp.]
MNQPLPQDWDPTSAAALLDQRATFDDLRERCPVAYSDFLGWSLFRHQDVLRVLNDSATFSSVVSRHLSVPNGMDPPEHTGYRRIVERYFQPARMQAFEPPCREIAARLVRDLAGRDTLEFISVFAQPFAVRVQCAFLGWPAHLHEPLRVWTQKNREASLALDRPAMAALASEFARHVNELLQNRRTSDALAESDIVTSLLAQQVDGRPLRDEEIASILRNWTVGEVGTISASVGILAHYLAQHGDLQQQLRAQPSLLPEAIDEMLRLHGPLVANRRRTTRPVEIRGRQIAAGERLSLNWMAANRDPRVFEAADTFRLGRDPAANLLYGAGIHVCPGAPLARMELLVVMQALLGGTTRISLPADPPPTLAVYPASGFASLPLRVQ